MMEPRSYRGESDFEKMMTILVAGRQAGNGTYYVHVGDVQWWLFYPNQEAEFAQRIFLWEDGGMVIGWCLLTPGERFFDVFVHPAERGTERAAQMYAWAEERLREIVKAQGGENIRTMWVFEEDEVVNELLKRHGFTVSDDFMFYFIRSLANPLSATQLPEGCTVRHVAGEHECQKRAAASHGAFQSKRSFEEYWPRYLSFMQSRVYDCEHDLVVVAPDGRAAACCVIWLDPVNKVGLFEPVGTHPDFQRKGMGSALMLESLRRMKANGVETAIVCAECDNGAAIRLYEAVGFQIANRLRMYGKNV